MGVRDNFQASLSTAEVMTTALVAADLFGGCFEQSRDFLRTHGYIPNRLGKSRFNTRLHALPLTLWPAFFHLLGEAYQPTNASGAYLGDSLPVPVGDNLRLRRCR